LDSPLFTGLHCCFTTVDTDRLLVQVRQAGNHFLFKLSKEISFDTMMVILYLAGLLVLLVVSASFSAAETAIVGIPHTKVHKLLNEGKWGSKSLHRLKRKMRTTLSAILIANNIINTVISSLSTLLAIEVLGSAWLGVSIGVIFFFILMFGEIFPKTFSTVYSEKVARYSAPYIEALAFLLSPLISVVQFVPDLILGPRELGRKIVSDREIYELMELGMAENVLEQGEVSMIKKVLLFNDIPVKDVMTPFERVAKMNADETVESAIKLVSFQTHTRFPLVDGTGRIIGSLKVKNLFRHAYEGKGKKVSELADKPLFVDSEIKIDDVFGLMKRDHRHIAYVTDAPGSVIGIVTTDDILEELVGEF
jgi:putative hemolysin